MNSSTIGIVGLGLLGSALAERALNGGFSVVGFDIRRNRRQMLKRLGGRPAESLREIALCCRQIVFSLPTTSIVESVVRELGKDLQPGVLVIDTTTGDPAVTVSVGRRLSSRRVGYVDATIAGSSAQARAGDVIVLAGGGVRNVKACERFFACFARQVFHVGPVGAGAQMKLVVNLALGLNRAVLAEALEFARNIGVRPELALEILKAGPSFSRVMDSKGKKMIARDFSTEAKLSQHLKDVRLILALGERTGAELPLSELHARLLSELEAAGLGDFDNSAIIRAFKRRVIRRSS